MFDVVHVLPVYYHCLLTSKKNICVDYTLICLLLKSTSVWEGWVGEEEGRMFGHKSFIPPSPLTIRSTDQKIIPCYNTLAIIIYLGLIWPLYVYLKRSICCLHRGWGDREKKPLTPPPPFRSDPDKSIFSTACDLSIRLVWSWYDVIWHTGTRMF